MSDLYFGDNHEDFEAKKKVIAPRKPSYLVQLTMDLFNIREEPKAVKILTYFSIAIFAISAIIFIHAFFIGNSSQGVAKNPYNKILDRPIKTE